ncbi:hypothetical protein TWF281_010970 [Arthrobotrys megalospora]
MSKRSSKFNFKQYDGGRVQKRGYRKNETWDEHKDFILDLVQRGEKHKDILQALKDERGFTTNLNQLKSKLGIWGASSKNLAKKQRKWIYTMHQRRKAEGKETVFYFGDTGQEVTDSQMGSIMKTGERAFADESPGSPGELELTTPPPMTSGEDEEDEAIDDAISDGEAGQADIANVTVEKSPMVITSPISPDSPTTSQVSIQNPEPEVPGGPTMENEPPSSATNSPPTETTLPSTFENIYKKVLHSLESFHLAANSSAATADNISPVEGIDSIWPASLEVHTTELAEWMETVYQDAEMFVEMVHEMVGRSAEPFSNCRDAVIEWWIKEYDEDPLPYHISWAIVNGVPLKPVVNEWEDIPRKVGDTAASEVIERNTWVQIEDSTETLLTKDEWDQIDYFFTKYYRKLKKFSDKIAKSNENGSFVVLFRPRAAHLQKLRTQFGEFNYFTISALEAFADACYQIHTVPDEDALFIYECAMRAFNKVGLTYSEAALDLYTHLGLLRRNKKNFLGALACHQTAYMIAELRWGIDSVRCIEFVSTIADFHMELGWTEEGNYVLRRGLTHIQSAVAKAEADDYDTHYELGKALAQIASLYKENDRKDVAALIGRFSIQQYTVYRNKHTGDDQAKDGWVPKYMGEAFLLLKDYENAARMFQSAFSVFSDFYGEQDKRSMDAIKNLCKSMTKRGLIMYTVPILERALVLRSGRSDEDEDGVGFEIWMRYMKTVMKVTGRGTELAELRKQLTGD